MSHTRRQFLSRSAQGAALLGAGGAAGYLVGRRGADRVLETAAGLAKDRAEVATIDTGARRAHRIGVGPDDRIYLAADLGVAIFSPSGERLADVDVKRPARCVAVLEDGTLLVGVKDHVEVFGDDGERRASWRSLGGDAILSGIAAAGDDVFLADAGNRTVWRMNRNGEIAGRIERDGAAFAAPPGFFSVASGRDGLVHVADAGRHRVETYTSGGARVAAWGERSRSLAGFGGCCNPVSVALLSGGGFVTAERGQPRVKRYDASGRFVGLIAGPERFEENARASVGDEKSLGCHSGGLDVAVDSAGRILVLDRVTAEIYIFAGDSLS